MKVNAFAAQCFGIRVAVEGGRRLLDDVSFAIPECGVHGLIGPNGAGKSTALRALLGVMPLSGGRIEIGARPLAGWAPRALAAHLGYLPQQPVCHWDLTVREMLDLRVDPEVPAVAGLFARCRIRSLLERRFSTLSGGEQARVSLARALAHAPRLLLADEPAAHLDLAQQHDMLRLLRETAASCAVLVVLHDLHLAARYCDSVSVLAGGRCVATGAPAEVLREDVLRPAFAAPVRVLRVDGTAYFSLP